MRSAKAFLACAAFATILRGQQPIAVGGDRSAGSGAGVVKFLDWYPTTPSSCSDGATGFCVGHRPQGDTYYWTAWLPNANGLPVTNGLPVVGTINDYSLGSLCSGNIALLQLDKWSWAAPNASHVTKVNCMPSFGTTPAASNAPSGWNGHLTSTDSVGNAGTWKSRVPFSKGGILYLPVERQISQGGASVHDATFIMSPDSGAHWCNPYTWASRAGGPGCDSSNWQSDGDAPKCDAPDSSHPCTNAGYLDASHSSIMWKGMTFGTENWSWINYANQDGQPPPAGVTDGCDPAAYTCFMLMPGEGALGRVPNASSILDISAWQYYTCPTLTENSRCPTSDAASWTPNFADRTPVVYLTYSSSQFNGIFSSLNPYSVMYLKEFRSYIMTGQAVDMAWAPAPEGPWTKTYMAYGGAVYGNFFAPSPALGYNVISTNPPRVQLTMNSNSYLGGQGAPNIVLYDIVAGRQMSGEAFQSVNLQSYGVAGASYQYSSGNIAGAFPRKGLVWAFDFLDHGGSGRTNYPFFMDRANYSAVMTACEGSYLAASSCGSMSAAHGTAMTALGIQTNDTGENYSAHFQVARAASRLNLPAALPAAMLGDGTYSVVGVYKLNGITGFHRAGNIWSAGTPSGAVANTTIALDQIDGTMVLNWNASTLPRYNYTSNFTMTQGNWYFVAVTVRPQGGACGSACTPVATAWVGGATSPGLLTDVLAGAAYTARNSAGSKTPAVNQGPFVVGLNGSSPKGYQSSMSYASLLVYDRALSSPEVQTMYRTMQMKLKSRGIVIQ